MGTLCEDLYTFIIMYRSFLLRLQCFIQKL